MTNNKKIFVTGATGNQGGAVVRTLANQGFKILALSRNANSVKAQNLTSLNIQVVEGDLNNADTYREYLKDVYGIFSVQAFEKGVEKEIKQGITLATLAKEYGIKHFVYSSAVGAQQNTGVPHIDSKFKIENHIKHIELPFTIIRPTSLFENFLLPQVKKGILKGKLVQPTENKTVLQYIAAEDIGNAVAKFFHNTEIYLGRTIPLASEQLTGFEVAGKFSTVLNKKMKYEKLPVLITRLFLGKSLYKMFKWMDEKSVFQIEDVNTTKTEFSNLLSLESWIEKNFNPIT